MLRAMVYPQHLCQNLYLMTMVLVWTCHQSILSNGKPIFYADSGYANLSDEAKFYIGGLLKHAPSLLAFTNPTINSFKRLVPGYEAPVN